MAVAEEPLLPLTAPEGSGADTQILDTYEPESILRVRADLMWLHRSKPNNAALVTDFTPGGIVLLDASDFKFQYETGPEIAILRQINDDWNVEGRFFRIDGWEATRGSVHSLESDVQYATPFRIGVPSPTPIILDTTIAGTFRSELTDVEINGRRKINDFWSLLVGFRYMGLDDRLTIQQGVNFGLATFMHDVGAVNDLYGFQIGADMNLWSRGRLSVEGLVKAGVYGNHAANHAHISLTNSSLTSDSNASADQAAFAGEMSITGVYRFNKHWSLRGGYQYLWIAGVAQASDQVAVSDPLAHTAAVSFTGNPSYDGAFVGLEFAR